MGDKRNLYELRLGDYQVELFSDKDTAQHVLEICTRAVRKARTLRVVRSLTDEVALVQGVVNEFEDKLNALELRPVVLRTRCRICPA